MKIYLASGYSVMNVPGRESWLANKYSPYRRLVSFHDKSRGNHIEQVLELGQCKSGLLGSPVLIE